MKQNNIKLKIYKTIFYMLLIVAIVVIGMIIYKYGSNQINEKESQEVVEAFSNTQHRSGKLGDYRCCPTR